jgi:hypothetical protein
LRSGPLKCDAEQVAPQPQPAWGVVHGLQLGLWGWLAMRWCGLSVTFKPLTHDGKYFWDRRDSKQ